MQEFKQKRIYNFLLLLLMLAFVIIKIPHLSLPYFWDESWSYGQAIHYMFKHGLSLMPDAIPHTLSKGHPLLFYFMAALGMKIFGSGVVGSHLFPFLLSLGLILMVFYVGKNFYNETIGLMAAVFMSCQALFISQSNLLLPEIMIALCTLIALYGYLKNKLLLFYIGSVGFLLAKETGFCLILFVLGWEFLTFIFSADKNLNRFLKRAILFSIPLIPAFVFYILQKKISGFYFYPLHVDMMEYEPGIILGKMKAYTSILFFSDGKFIAFILAIWGLITINKKNEVLRKKLIPCLVFIAFTLFYILFMSFQFISLRYSLTVLPLASICISVIIYYSLNYHPKLRLFVFTAIIFAMSTFTFFSGVSDRNTLGYIDIVKSDRKAIHYLAEKNYYNDTFYAQFLMATNMKFYEAGYLPDKRIFANFSENESGDFDLFILTSYDYFPTAGKFIQQKRLKLEKEFSSGSEWTKIYRAQNP